MTLKIDLNTGPNHYYSDLEAEKLVYKLLTLVLCHRILFRKGRGYIGVFWRFSTLKDYGFCSIDFSDFGVSLAAYLRHKNHQNTLLEPPASWSHTFFNIFRISLPSWAPTWHPRPHQDPPKLLWRPPKSRSRVLPHRPWAMQNSLQHSPRASTTAKKLKNLENDTQKSKGYLSEPDLWRQDGCIWTLLLSYFVTFFRGAVTG